MGSRRILSLAEFRTMRKLEDEGYLNVTIPNDEESAYIRLTEKGGKALQEVKERG